MGHPSLCTRKLPREGPYGLASGSAQFGLRDGPGEREIPFDALRLLRAGSSLRRKNGSTQDDAAIEILRVGFKLHDSNEPRFAVRQARR